MNVLSVDIGIKNFAICILNNNEIIYWEVIQLEKKCKNINWNNLIKKLYTILVNLIQKYKIDMVLIEQQMISTMKMISIGVLMFFITKNINCKIISSTEKLKYFKGKKTTYNERKNIAISLTHFYLLQERFHPWNEFFENHKKKDDLSDCFLYCFNFIL